MPPLAWLSPRRSIAASVALVALASAAACSVLVGNSLPHYTCSLDPTYTQVCSDMQVCAPIEGQPDPPTMGNCVDRCSRTRCGTGLSCGANDWCVSVNDASADGTTGGDSTMAEANGDDAADEDEDETTDATADGPMPMRSDAGSDAPADATSNAEGGRGDAGVCASGGIGCPCSTPRTTTGCELLAFCADREIVSGVSMGDAGAGAAGAGGDAAVGVCTKACCASTDCDKGSVCLATGAGGNYCVPGAAVGDRSTTGPLNGIGGQICDAGTSCRSGLCAPNGLCADTCCTTAPPGPPPRMSMGTPPPQCATGTTCRFGAFQGSMSDMPYVARCALTMGTFGNGATCTSNSDCKSNLCVLDAMGTLTCRDPCRKPEDCSGMGMFQTQTCEYVQLSGTGATMSGDLVAACVPLITAGPGPADAASDWAPCKTSIDCARGYCAQSGDAGPNVCVSVCFGDGDCVSSGTCRPQTLQVNMTTYSVLACK